MAKFTRRLTTGLDNNSRSIIIDDEQVESFSPYETLPSFEITNLFYTEDTTQTLKTRHLPTPYDINLPEMAFRVLLLKMPPKKELIKNMQDANQPIPEDWIEYGLHNTDSIDYLYILSGTVNYVIDNQVIELKQGDFLTQIGPEHVWINESDDDCQVLCVMVGTKASLDRKKMAVE